MIPARQRLSLKSNRASKICELLIALGLPRKQVYATYDRSRRGPFWTREAGNLDLWLERAHTAYRCRMVNLHPDRGGSVRDAATLNQVWGRVKMLFAKRGVTL